MGLVLFVTAIILLLTRFWVMRDGGMPDGGMGRSEVNMKRFDGSNGFGGGVASSSSSDGANGTDSVPRVPDKGAGAPAPKAHTPRA